MVVIIASAHPPYSFVNTFTPPIAWQVGSGSFDEGETELKFHAMSMSIIRPAEESNTPPRNLFSQGNASPRIAEIRQYNALRANTPSPPPVNVNPFSPNMPPSPAKPKVQDNASPVRHLTSSPSGRQMPPAPNKVFREPSNLRHRKSRFAQEFQELKVLGKGSFGTVYKCRKRLDGCLYAVKCIDKKIRGNLDQDRMMKEVFALSALGTETCNNHVVRYFTAWLEHGHLFIQTELCDKSVEALIQERWKCTPNFFADEEVVDVLCQVLEGLLHIHSHGLVHLDIKPANIFIKGQTFKIGDLGLVTSANACRDVGEGDARYLSKELLAEDYTSLPQSDLFSLGATAYEMCGGGHTGSSNGNQSSDTASSISTNPQSGGVAPHARPHGAVHTLPANGPEWARIREHGLRCFMHNSSELFRIISTMMSPVPRCVSIAQLFLLLYLPYACGCSLSSVFVVYLRASW
jgi:tRNA A-37 threonylcarbamoyl transferase component Bud32